MKTRLQPVFILLLTLALLFSGVGPLPSTWAASNEKPEELEVTWQIKANANRAWFSESTREEDNKVYARYDGNDSFSLNMSGTATLTRTGTSYEGYPYFQSTTDNQYSRSCSGGGTYTTWYLNELQKWIPGEGLVTKEFQSTRIENWQYRWPGQEHEDAGDNPIWSLVIIPPESENDPPRYRISLEPFFFITYDTADEYFETTGTYKVSGSNWEGSYSDSGDLGDHAGQGAPSQAEQAWYDKMYNTPEGTLAEGDLTYAGGEYKGQGKVQHTLVTDDGQSSIDITFEFNRQPVAKEIQPNQVLGRYEYRDEDDYDPTTDFAAGKDTVIQVFLPDDVKAQDQSDAELEVYRDGSKIATLSSFKKDTSDNALIFIPPSRTSCGNWQAGTYKFVVTLGDSAEDLTLDNVRFQKQRKLRVLAVPVKANYAGTIETPGNQWKNGGTFMRRVYHVAYNEFTSRQRRHNDASDASYDITTDAGQYKLWQSLAAMQDSSSPYDQIIGYIEKGIQLSNGNILQGYTYGAPVSIVVNSDQDMQATVAHEVAHAYAVGDEYQGGSYHLSINSPPLGYRGTDWDNDNVTVTANDPKMKPFPGASGVLISEDLHPYDTSGRGLLKDSIGFMGSGAAQSKNWINPSVWKHLFSSLAASSTPAAVPQSLELQELTGGIRVVEASGWISQAGEVEIILPWPSYQTTEPVAIQTGTYTIQAVDAAGTVLASNGFTPTSFVRTNPPRELDPAPFSQVRVPFPAGTTKFIIADQTNTVLAEYAVSAHAPTVIITSPATTAGQSLTGLQTITWQGEDANGGSLSYKVEYTPNGSDWELLAFDVTDHQWVQDFDLLPGGEQAQIRITASDGINSSVPALSGIFRVPVRAPEVLIEAPESGTIFSTVTGGVVLQGSAYDPQEGQIYDDNRLVWTSDRVGELGRGPAVFTDALDEGEHVLTLTATNSTGQVSAQSVTVNITSLPPEEPVAYTVTLQANPTAGGSVTGAGTYEDGGSVTVEAVANAGYTFVNWTDGDNEVSQSPSYSFIISANRNLTANFRANEPAPTDECFIATAAFGSKFTWPVELLRHFRDQYLLTNPPGTAFVKFYYQHSPPIAAVIAHSQPLKQLVRLLLAPIIAGVYLLYHPLLLTGALLGLLVILRRRRLAHQ